MGYNTVSINDEGSIIAQEDMHLYQNLVQGAYIMLTAAQVGFNVDKGPIRSAIKQKKVSLPSYGSIEKKMYQLHDELISMDKSSVHVEPEKLKVFFDLDMYMVKEYGPCPDIYEYFLDFTYDSLCKLSNYQLECLKMLIDRLQIMICSSICYEDFTVAFSRISCYACGTFLDGISKVNLSRFREPRGRMLLAMYRATTDSKFFESKSKYYNFIKLVFIWLFNTKNLISRILKPSHKLKDDSRLYRSVTTEFGYSKDVADQTTHLVSCYQALRAIVQSSYPIDLKNFCDDLFLVTLQNKSHSNLIKTCRFDIYYRVRKVFFEMLLGSVWNFQKNGWLVPTKEALFFDRLHYSTKDVLIKDWRQNLKTFENIYERFWKFNFRTVGPESKGQIQNKQNFVTCLCDIQKRWSGLRDKRIKSGVVPTKLSNTKLVNAPNLCFPNVLSYALDLYPLVRKGTIKNKDDRRILMKAADMLYHNVMNTMKYSFEMCIYDLSIEKLRGGNNESLRWLTYH